MIFWGREEVVEETVVGVEERGAGEEGRGVE